MRLRVLTFNVQHDAGPSQRTSLLNRELQRLAPGLVVLQEVCYPDQWDQLAELVADTGLNTTHQADVLGYVPPLAEQYGGTAVATRWPHRVVEVVGQPQIEATDLHWWTLAVSVQLPDLGELLFITPTSAWRLDAETRESTRPSRSPTSTQGTGLCCRRSSPATSTQAHRRRASDTSVAFKP